MINGNIVNGNVINGSSDQKEYLLSVLDNLSIHELVSLAKQINADESDAVSVNENVKISFNKAMAKSENLSIAENLLIELGDLILHIEDEPVRILENLSFNLQREILMEDQIKYYLNLLIIQYRNKARAVQHMTTLIKVALLDLLPTKLQNSFSIDLAEGPQLDILGQYIGIKRRVKTFTNEVTLSDIDYRLLLKIKISSNNLGSSLYDIQNFIFQNLNGTLKAFDHRDMAISFYLNSNIINQVLGQAIVKQNILPRPMGVSYSAIVYIPIMNYIFGFRTYEFDSGSQVGFNTYTSHHTERRLLKYEDSL